MPISVVVARVRDKAGVVGTGYDARISVLIAEMVPAIEFAVAPSFLDTGDATLQATLNLGATELVAGELTSELVREPGATEALSFGLLEITPARRNLGDPYGLKRQGTARLTPFLKQEDAIRGTFGVAFGGERTPEEP